MDKFLNWLRVELLRLRSFDWGNGAKELHRLKDGVMKFTSIYWVRELVDRLGISENDILTAIDSDAVNSELEGKSFTISWKDKTIRVNWLEEGISEWKTDLNQDYYEQDGNFYQKFRIIERIIYLDGTERVVKDRGERDGVWITKEEFEEAKEKYFANEIERNPLGDKGDIHIV